MADMGRTPPKKLAVFHSVARVGIPAGNTGSLAAQPGTAKSGIETFRV